jgi:ethanolamine utilization protein EutA
MGSSSPYHRNTPQPDYRIVHSAWTPDHDHDDADVPLEDNPIWQQDNVTLHSVGMDIGSSGTQVLFSRLHLRRIGEDLSSRYVVVRRSTLYRSPIALTPYTAIGSVLAERAGDLVTVTAGHHMEAMLAAYGSGAAKISHDRCLRILNVDVGGGTTKLAVISHGRVEATAALHVGGRLQVVDDAGRLVRLEPAGREHAARLGLGWELGAIPGEEQITTVAEAMADALITAIVADTPQAEASGLFLTAPLGRLRDIDGVMFSGGVAEYVYNQESRRFGDLGAPLGRALRARVDAGALPFSLLPPGECIRATALGASEYSVQLSGSTGWISEPDVLLPRRNLQVVRPRYRLGRDVDRVEIAAAIRHQLQALDATASEADIALALQWEGEPSYRRISALAAGIRDGLADRITGGRPVYLMLDGDVAMNLGRLLTEEFQVGAPLLVIDGLALRDFDYIDMGKLRHPSRTVPVTIKSLLFPDGSDPAAAATG